MPASAGVIQRVSSSAAVITAAAASPAGDSGSDGLTVGEVVAIVVCSALLALLCALFFLVGRIYRWFECLCCCCPLCACCRRRRRSEEEEVEKQKQYTARGQGLLVVANPSVVARRVAGLTLAPQAANGSGSIAPPIAQVAGSTACAVRSVSAGAPGTCV